MEQRCNICLDETCGGKRDCDCTTCSNRKDCPKVLYPIIRITLKCTQKCTHCCFTCSPSKTEMMSLETAGTVAKFLSSNDIRHISIMGGEFFLNPQWKEIFSLFLPIVDSCRIVTNGDWAISDEVPSFLSKHKNVYMSISKDKWHTNKNVDNAQRKCLSYKIRYNIATDEETKDESIVPVGRGDMSYGFYSFFGCYCHNPEKKYSFLIDEKGTIYKCGFGVWDYASCDEYKAGGFAMEFKEFNKRFYSVFIPNCSRCNMAYHSRKKEE